MKRTGSAKWEGDLKQGHGTVKLGSGAYSGSYSFGTRFGGEPGVNPEELLGAAHAACFSMAFANSLAQAGTVPRSVDTVATVRLESAGGASAIAGIDLVCRVDAPGMDPDQVRKIGEATKTGCIVSKALSAVPMTLDVTFANG